MHQTFFKHDMPSQHDVRTTRAKAKQNRWLEVCHQVDQRDKGKCRACGRTCNTKALDPLHKGHRHHVTFRSKGGQDIASNLLTLCPGCHDRVHAKRTLRIEATTDGADGPVSIWLTNLDGLEYLSRRELSVHVVEKD